MALLCITNAFAHHIIVGSATYCRFQVNVRDVEPGTPQQVREGAEIEHIFSPTIKWQGGYYTMIEVPQTILKNIPRLAPHS